jgi:hypothetical protein
MLLNVDFRLGSVNEYEKITNDLKTSLSLSQIHAKNKMILKEAEHLHFELSVLSQRKYINAMLLLFKLRFRSLVDKKKHKIEPNLVIFVYNC